MYVALIAKEVRALLPVWVVAGLVLTADAIFGPVRLVPAGALAYAVGAVALGAQSIGHEYMHGTLGILLAQPADRRRLLLIKQFVLVVMLLSLLAVAEASILNQSPRPPSISDQFILIVIPTLCGLFIAPWMTMATRATLPGAVFSVAIPGTLLIVVELIGDAIYGVASTEVDLFRAAVWSRAMLVLCGAAAILGWRKFLRLEVVDGGHNQVAIPRWFGRSEAARPRHPLWMLAKKELHLQQLSFVVAFLFAAGWTALVMGAHWRPDEGVGQITILFSGLVSILAGSMASAEERQLGTFESQMLLPVPRWQQWAVKVAVVFGVAGTLGAVLAAGLPASLGWVFSSRYPRLQSVFIPRLPYVLITVAVVTSSSLYLSSVCRSGIRAVILSLPVAVAALLYLQWATAVVLFVFRSWRLYRPLTYWNDRAPMAWSFAAAFVALLVWFAFLNHSSAERSATRVLAQVVLVAGVVLLTVTFAA